MLFEHPVSEYSNPVDSHPLTDSALYTPSKRERTQTKKSTQLSIDESRRGESVQPLVDLTDFEDQQSVSSCEEFDDDTFGSIQFRSCHNTIPVVK